MKYPEVLVISEATTTEQEARFIETGDLPPGSIGMTLNDFKAIGRVGDCDCGLIQCVCQQARQHKEGCPLRLALTCAISIECDKHGLDVCPECTPCICS